MYTEGVKQEEGLLCFIKRRKLAECGHSKRRPDGLVLTRIEVELPGKIEEIEGNGLDQQHQDLDRRWTHSG